jgi:hypothetical protein
MTHASGIATRLVPVVAGKIANKPAQEKGKQGMTCEAIYCFDMATVRFAIYPDGLDGPRILAEISEDALRDLFGARGGGDSLVRACQTHFNVIETTALARHRAAPLKPITLNTRDFASPAALTEVTDFERNTRTTPL